MINLRKILLILLLLASLYAIANDEHVVNIDDSKIYLDKNNFSTVIIENSTSDKFNTCNIENWKNDDTDNGDGMIRSTTDKRAIIFYSSNRYLLINELKECKNGQVKLYKSPDPDNNMLQDINFNKQLYLSLGIEDKDSWSATISYFGSNENLIKAPGFYDKNRHDSIGEGFSIGGNGYGKISPNGQYVAPNGLGCDDGEYGEIMPGVWDIGKKKWITFPRRWDDLGRVINSDEVYEKCKKLFYGEATLEKLGGKLNNAIYIQRKELQAKAVIVENISGSKITIPLKKGIYNAYANTQLNSIDGHDYLAIFQSLPSKPRGFKGRCSGDAETWLYIYEISNKKAGEINKILVGSCNKEFSMGSLNNNIDDYSSFLWNKDGFTVDWYAKRDKNGGVINHTNYFIKKNMLQKEDVLEDNRMK
ncbi:MULTISPECIES: hypothetical protein [Photorhabdus]|uniref:hypothetical protein n=1 Tax=Photorhabdus TaxID=29487 RepID=UPI0021D4EBCB|nr:hypothetical protein [Photorhabdus kayaii]MCT8354433.1 hypothetical protein [Photorhabdus kayaii]